jgi:hypothetical protein
MVPDPIGYQWSCPICGIRRIRLLAVGETATERQMRRVVLGHVRQTEGGGHGAARTLPPTFDPDSVDDHVRAMRRFGGRTAP